MTAPATLLLDISRDQVDHRLRRDDSWYGYVEEKNWGAIPFSVSYLYRGQVDHCLPMLPSIARGLESQDIRELWRSPISDQAKIILRLAQSWWFSRELARHPISAHASKQGLDLNPIALAQHYGIPTGYLDLTDDFSVAAFFATCQLTASGWRAVDSGVGVIYRVCLDTFDSPFGRYEPLGPQILPRPTEQCAWVTELPLCHSFDGWPQVSILTFEHDKHVGEYFLNQFSGGELLFPEDPLAHVASEIINSGEIPKDIVDAAIESFATDPVGVKRAQVPELRKEIAKISNLIGHRTLLSDERIASLLDDSNWCNRMLSPITVKWHAVRRVPVDEEG